MSSTGPPARRRLQDPIALRALLLDAFGSINSAADGAGLEQSVLNRLCRGEAGRGISDKYFNRLRGVVPAPRRAAFDALFFSQFALAYLGMYVGWLDEQLNRIGGNRWTTVDDLIAPPKQGPEPPELRPDANSFHPQELKPGEGMLGEFQVMVRKLRTRRADQGGDLWPAFDRAMATRGVDAGRRVLATFRIVEPLLAWGPTEEAVLERSVDELIEASELEEYLKAAMSRERILLRRDPAGFRAQLYDYPVDASDPAACSLLLRRARMLRGPVTRGLRRGK